MSRLRPAVGSAAADVIRHLPPGIKRAVTAAVRQLAENPAAGAPLRGELEGLWKYRVRRFRVVYRVDRARKMIHVLAVGERRSIYEEVAELLRSRK